ncbi:NUDIX hydrolase [soil metagenome]
MSKIDSVRPAPDRPVVGVGAIVVRDDRLLVVKRGREPSRGRWSVPGGRLEFGETLESGAVRELAEETGLEGTVMGFCGLAERITDSHHLVIHDFWVWVAGDANPVAGDDADAVAWVTRSQLEDLPTVPLLHEFLRDHGVWDGPPSPPPPTRN